MSSPLKASRATVELASVIPANDGELRSQRGLLKCTCFVQN